MSFREMQIGLIHRNEYRVCAPSFPFKDIKEIKKNNAH